MFYWQSKVLLFLSFSLSLTLSRSLSLSPSLSLSISLLLDYGPRCECSHSVDYEGFVPPTFHPRFYGGQLSKAIQDVEYLSGTPRPGISTVGVYLP